MEHGQGDCQVGGEGGWTYLTVAVTVLLNRETEPESRVRASDTLYLHLHGQDHHHQLALGVVDLLL